MDTNYLSELIEEVEKRDGGLVLNLNQVPAAVVLSVSKYNELLENAGKAGSESGPVSPYLKSENAVKETILITGGLGYLGVHSAYELEKFGYKVVVLDDNLPHNRDMLPKTAIFVKGSVSDNKLLAETLKKYNCQIVLHLAEISEGSSAGEPASQVFRSNVTETLGLLEAMDSANVKNIIFSSSGSIYGRGGVRPFMETDSPNPQSPYAYTKFLAEKFLNFYANYKKFNCIALRYFNLCGVGEGVRMYNPEFAGTPLERAISAAQEPGSDGMVIYGDDYTTFDGTNLTDYLHVTDAATAAALAANKIHFHKGFDIYNVGSGKGYSEKQVAGLVAEITGKIFPLEIHPKLKNDGEFLISDCFKIKNELNFSPKFSTLENIVQSSL